MSITQYQGTCTCGAGSYGCDGCTCCDYPLTHDTWQPSTTLERACELVRQLLDQTGCEYECPDWEICKLIRLQCELCGGRHDLATLAVLTVADLLLVEARKFALKGNVSTLTVKINNVAVANELRQISKEWKASVKDCTPRRKFAIIQTGQSCHEMNHNALYQSCGLTHYCKDPRDEIRVIDCNWDCCDDCES